MSLIRGDALRIPLRDECVDLVITSPPYWALRSYQDNGEHYDGQIGSEDTPQAFLEALWAVTEECVRVLKPTGSMFFNLGDSYSSGQRFDSGFTAQDAAWLAGVIDSDGSISIRVDNSGRSHVAWTRVGQMKSEVCQRIGAVTGTGQVWQDARGVWNWNAAAQQARWVLERIWPWLRIKQRQALAAIDLMESKAQRGRKGSWNPLTDDDIRHRENIRQAVLAWNRGEEYPQYEPPPAALVELPTTARFIPPKSLMGLPWRYAIGCIDQLGLILRAEIIASKVNGLPESVTDRVRRSHEQWFHFTKAPRYFAAVDEVREPHREPHRSTGRIEGHGTDRAVVAGTNNGFGLVGDKPRAYNALGKLPGSVWPYVSEPLRIPDYLNLPDHYAAFCSEWPRKLILGWSPSGICTACGEGRVPVVAREFHGEYNNREGQQQRHRSVISGGTERVTLGATDQIERTITGYACACPDTSAPTRPAVVLDPFGGTGTVAMVARALGRYPAHIDLSADYLRLARWRIYESGHARKAEARTWRERQGELFG